MKLPPEMLAEIARLGHKPEGIEWVAQQEGLEFARYYLQKQSESAALFEKWFPRLCEFAKEKRLASPVPDDSRLTPEALIHRRILCEKITSAERIPQSGNFNASIFSAPLSVLPLVMADWPSTYRHPVFLTPEEKREWYDRYDEPDDAPWWFCFQDWNVEVDPGPDSYWLEHSVHTVPEDAVPLVVSWGLAWGSLAGGQKAELWCVGADGVERRLGDLGDVTF